MIEKVLGENGGSFSPEMLRDAYEVLFNSPVQDCFSVVKDFNSCPHIHFLWRYSSGQLTFTVKRFKECLYMCFFKNLGGSEKIAQELFVGMDVSGDGVVTEKEISQTLDDILVKFEKESQPDPSSKF